MLYYQNQFFYQTPEQIRYFLQQNPYQSFFCINNLPAQIDPENKVCDNIVVKQISKKSRKAFAEDSQDSVPQQFEKEDSDYRPHKIGKGEYYKNKNTETNLSNQIFSFLNLERSRPMFLKLFQGEQRKLNQFYDLMKKFKKVNKKYMNRKNIAKLMTLKEKTPLFTIFRKSNCGFEIEDLRRAIRIGIKYFLQNQCDPTFLTSKKLNKGTLLEHFVRKRKFIEYLRRQMKKN